MMATLFEVHGYKVETARDGEEGLERAREHRPCLILLDLMMTGMDGRTFRREQQRIPEIAQVPVVIVSAHPDAPFIAKQLGAACVEKPVPFDHLMATVDAHCLRT